MVPLTTVQVGIALSVVRVWKGGCEQIEEKTVLSRASWKIGMS